MAENQDKRKQDDRRAEESNNQPNNRRRKMRRKEDKTNLRTYYIVLGINLALLAVLGIGSYIFQ